jgi:benzoylformate decarboxylase
MMALELPLVLESNLRKEIMKTVRDAFFETARKLGLTTLFGNPGSTEETMLKDFPSDFTYILGLQEASVIAMADAYSQVKRAPALVNLHTSAGTGNALGNIETAFHNRTPLIITAGQQTREMLLMEPYLTNTDPTEIAKPFVKWAYQPQRAEDVPGALMRAYAMAVQPPAGPVYLSLPMDDFEKAFKGSVEIRKVSKRLGADQRILSDIIAELNNAKNPVLVFGGVLDHHEGSWDQAVRFAEKLQAPVWAGPKEGRPGFPESHELFQGNLKGSIADLSKQLKGHDFILVMGAPVFRYYPYVAGEILPKGAQLFHVSDDPRECAKAPVGTSVLADPGYACEVLMNAIEARAKSTAPKKTDHKTVKMGKLITPEFLFSVINQVKPAESLIVEESPSTNSEQGEQIKISESLSFLSMCSGVLGFGLAGAVGAAIAEKELKTNRKVIAIIGDGSANYVIQSLYTAAQLKTPVCFIILKNSSYNILKAFSKQQEAPGVPGLDIPGIDFVSIARGYGVEATGVSDPEKLREHLVSALSSDQPFLLEVTVDPKVPELL